LQKALLTRTVPIALGLAAFSWALSDAITGTLDGRTFLLSPIAAGLLGSCIFKERLKSALLGFGLAVVSVPAVLAISFHAYDLRYGEMDGVDGAAWVFITGLSGALLSPSLAALSTHLQRLVIEYP
jgi:hypothetical protein